MNENRRKYFTTGEFATICGVNKQTLFHYDKIGLLSPEVKNDKGYRFYSYQQFSLFTVIELLKEVDMSLEDIKQFLHNKNPEQFVNLLEEKRLDIQRKIDHLEHTKKMIETKISLTKDAISENYEDIRIEERPKEQLILSSTIKDNSDREFIQSVFKFINYLSKEKLDIGHPIGAILSEEQILEKDYNNYTFLYTKGETHLQNVEYFTKPKGTYVVAFHIGEEHTISNTYEKMYNYIEQYGYKPQNFSYEEYILDEVSVNGVENYVTKIEMQIARVE